MQRVAGPVFALVASALIAWGGSQDARRRSPSGQGDKDSVTLPYRFAADWPRLPAGWTLGLGSGIATDARNRVYALHRGRHPVLVCDSSGKLLHDWGDGIG